jgi:hypothetical protein
MPKQYAVKLEMVARQGDENPSSTFLKCLENWKVPKNHITDVSQLYVWEKDGTVFRWDPCLIGEDLFIDFVIREPDHEVSGRYWTSQISAYLRENKITASIEISTIDLVGGTTLPAGNRPKIVNTFAQNFDCYIGSGLLSGSSKPVYRDDAPDFIRFSVRDLYRKDPILIVYPYENDRYPLEDYEWVKEFQGFGTLFHASSMKSTQAISRLLSDSERPAPGDIQIWWPPQNGLITVTRLPLEKSANRYARLNLAKDLALQMAELFQEPIQFNLFRDKRSIYHARARERSKIEFEEALKKAQDNGEANEIANLYTIENNKLKERNLELEDEIRRERAKIDFLQQRISHLSNSNSIQTTLSRAPETTSDSVQIAAEESAFLVFLPDAFASSSNNPYRNPIEVLEALRVLNQAAETSISNRNRLGDSLSNWLKIRGCDYGDGISELSSKEDRKQHEFIHDGKTFFCEKHLRLGSGKHSDRDCLRIYFSIEPHEKKWIVAHVGEHLNCASS